MFINRNERLILVNVLVFLIFCFRLTYVYIGTTYYLEKQTKEVQAQLIDTLYKNQYEYAAVAEEMLTAPTSNTTLYYSETYTEGISESLQRSIVALRESANNIFDEVYTNSNIVLYPEDACVFRCTVMRYGEVYSWVDLVFSYSWSSFLDSESPAEMLESGTLLQINENWYIVVTHGY